jgi:hypothetical protein
MASQISSHPEVYLKIEDGPDIGYMFTKMEWKSFTNGGYVIRARLEDPKWNILKSIATDFYLEKGRRGPTRVIFELIWPENETTGKHLAFITDMDAKGINSGGALEFIAVDPPSYWLNAGDASGKAYTGTVKEVIEQVVKEYFIGPNGAGKVEVSKTLDNNKNTWWMMRQDPKTFISSLIDWSSSITESKSNWIVSSGGSTEEDPTIWIKEQAKRKDVNYGLFVLDVNSPNANDAYDFEYLSDNFISVFQKHLITHGISAVSGAYYDRKLDKPKKIVHTWDENTSTKKNVDIDSKRGFAKPKDIPSPEDPHQWSTAFMAIPEHNAGDIGITYDKYIDGRSRTMFMNMLNMVMRIKLRVTGEPNKDLANSHNLGTSYLKIAWRDADNEPYFLDDLWLVYGFHHLLTRDNWVTDIYCARLDYDANAIKVGKRSKN